MTRRANRNAEPLPHAIDGLLSDLEGHWRLPSGCLRRGRVTCCPLSLNKAVRTPWGGIVACVNPGLGTELAATISTSDVGDTSLSETLEEVLHRVIPGAHCTLEVTFYSAGAPPRAPADVEVLTPQEFWPGDDDTATGMEHVFVIRDGPVVAARATCRRSLQFGERWMCAIGVATHRDYRSRGLGKRVWLRPSPTSLPRAGSPSGTATPGTCLP